MRSLCYAFGRWIMVLFTIEISKHVKFGVGRMRTTFVPKLISAVVISEAMLGMPEHASVMFSSTSSLFGAPGQGNYAAANAALEAFTQRRMSIGLSVIAIQWGAWAVGRVHHEYPLARGMTATNISCALFDELTIVRFGNCHSSHVFGRISMQTMFGVVGCSTFSIVGFQHIVDGEERPSNHTSGKLPMV